MTGAIERDAADDLRWKARPLRADASLSGLDFRDLRGRIDRTLEALLPPVDHAPQTVHAAMHYGLLAPGKRIRPLLTVLGAIQFGRTDDAALAPACAIEMVHTASLMLDDLPAMDDAAVRRGRPTTHLTFGEDVTILAAVALLSRAFEVIAASVAIEPQTRLDLIGRLAATAGSRGLVAGQITDLRGRSGLDSPCRVEQLNYEKTGVLFVAAVETGARIAGANAEALDVIRRFGAFLGLAFQTADDLIDVLATAEAAGKDVGRDANKSTLVSLYGSDGAKAAVANHVGTALAVLGRLDPNRDGPLAQFLEATFAPALA